MKGLLSIINFGICCSSSYSQGRIQFSAGLSKATYQDRFITPESSAHYGYFVGADSRLNDGKIYLILGGQFHNLKISQRIITFSLYQLQLSNSGIASRLKFRNQ